jgi:hypothetical protein
VNILQYPWSYSPRSALKDTNVQIAKHVDEFELEVKWLDGKAVRKQSIEMIKSLNTPHEKLDSSGDARKGVDVKFDFPVSTAAMYRNYTFVGREASLEEMDMFLLPKPQNTIQGVPHRPLFLFGS